MSVLSLFRAAQPQPPVVVITVPPPVMVPSPAPDPETPPRTPPPVSYMDIIHADDDVYVPEVWPEGPRARPFWESVPSRRLDTHHLDRQYNRVLRTAACADRVDGLLEGIAWEAKACAMREAAQKRARLERLLAENAAWEDNNNNENVEPPLFSEAQPSDTSAPYFRAARKKKESNAHQMPPSSQRPPLRRPPSSVVSLSVSSSSPRLSSRTTAASESQLRASVRESVATLFNWSQRQSMQMGDALLTQRSVSVIEDDVVTPYQHRRAHDFDVVSDGGSNARTLLTMQSAIKKVQDAHAEHVAMQLKVAEAMAPTGCVLNTALAERILHTRSTLQSLEKLQKDVEGKRRKAARLSDKLQSVLERLREEGIDEDEESDSLEEEIALDNVHDSSISDVYTANTTATDIVAAVVVVPPSSNTTTTASAPRFVEASGSSPSSRSRTPSPLPRDPDSRASTTEGKTSTVYPAEYDSNTHPFLARDDLDFYQHDSENPSPPARRRRKKTPANHHQTRVSHHQPNVVSVCRNIVTTATEEPRWAYDEEELRVATPDVSMVGFAEIGVDASCMQSHLAMMTFADVEAQTQLVVCTTHTTDVVELEIIAKVEEVVVPPPSMSSYLITLEGMSQWRREQMGVVSGMTVGGGGREVDHGFDVVEAHIARALLRTEMERGLQTTETSSSSSSSESQEEDEDTEMSSTEADDDSSEGGSAIID